MKREYGFVNWGQFAWAIPIIALAVISFVSGVKIARQSANAEIAELKRAQAEERAETLAKYSGFVEHVRNIETFYVQTVETLTLKVRELEQENDEVVKRNRSIANSLSDAQRASAARLQSADASADRVKAEYGRLSAAFTECAALLVEVAGESDKRELERRLARDILVAERTKQ